MALWTSEVVLIMGCTTVSIIYVYHSHREFCGNMEWLLLSVGSLKPGEGDIQAEHKAKDGGRKWKGCSPLHSPGTKWAGRQDCTSGSQLLKDKASLSGITRPVWGQRREWPSNAKQAGGLRSESSPSWASNGTGCSKAKLFTSLGLFSHLWNENNKGWLTSHLYCNY